MIDDLQKQNSSLQEQLNKLMNTHEASAPESSKPQESAPVSEPAPTPAPEPTPHPEPQSVTEPAQQTVPESTVKPEEHPAPQPVAPQPAPQPTENSQEPSQTVVTATIDPAMSDKLDKITESLNKMETKMSDINYKDQIIKDIHEDLQLYKKGLRLEFVQPVMKNIIIQLYDVLNETLKKYNEEASADPVYAKLRGEVKNIILNVEDLLYEYDVEPVVTKVGETFNPKIHTAVSKKEPPSDAQDRTIAEVTKTGFQNTTTGHYLRLPVVVVYAK